MSGGVTRGDLLWVDLEMTGLDLSRDVILQVAAVVTDWQLEVLDELSVDVWQPDETLARMSPVVREMHEATGLVARVRASRVDVRAAEGALMERVTGRCRYPAILCGKSLAMDRRFLERDMPGLAGYLHYRTLDVTSLTLLARAWYGEGALRVVPTAGVHDARVDVRNAIEELRHYRRTLFRPPA